MSAKSRPEPEAVSAEDQLGAFIDKFAVTDQRLIRGVRTAMRRRLPTANELVWDNYNFFVIGYSPTERPADSLLSIAARANGVGLCFIYGADLPDPKRLLLGSGRQTRFIRLESAGRLSHPDIEALIAGAIARARTPLPASGRGKLVIRSVSAKQRPRRRPAKQLSSARAVRPARRRGGDTPPNQALQPTSRATRSAESSRRAGAARG